MNATKNANMENMVSCGYYNVHSRPVVSTERANGRKDYQLLYIAKGKGHFFFDGKERIITEGNMILAYLSM